MELARWVSSTTPSAKNPESTTPVAASGGMRLDRSMPTISSAATTPATAAPTSRPGTSFTPATRNAMQTPGSVECATASPTRLRRRSTANAPSTPLVMPSTSAPATTTASV
ncbi:hypothetical protein BJF78_05410 [Pseudonocardia sp. CNS-139]|nr:hypothetical protein BJF78_05410 [Pseudonocardia sp. CNS-139]